MAIDVTEKYDLFNQSFYAGYFLHIPKPIVCSALEEVSRNMRKKNLMCPSLFDEMFELEAALFLNTFFGASDLSYINDDGERIVLKSLATSGAKSSVKKDSVDSSISREYFAPSFLPGEDSNDFPLGYIKKRLTDLVTDCENANNIIIGVGADIPCGADLCKYMPTKNFQYNIGCKNCR